MRKTNIGSIYQLKITLDQIKPPIWRRVLVPGSITLPKLHTLIQRVMGWQDYHMHGFRVGQTNYGQPDGDLIGYVLSENRIKLAQVASAEKCKFKYEYDYGDDWIHTVLVEKILPADDGVRYPICLTGKRACPPEDCGGPWGYVEFLEAINNPEHPEHEDMSEWVGEDFQPEAFDLDAVNAALLGIPI